MNKKLLYICRYSLLHEQNLKVKFDGERKGLEALGFTVYWLAFDAHSFYLMQGKNKEAISPIRFSTSKLYLHTLAFVDMYKAARKVLQSMDFDYLYVRNDISEWNCLQMYKLAHKKGIYSICEIPTYPPYKSQVKNPFFHLFLRISTLYDKACNPYIDLYAVIGAKVDSLYGKPAININNGVDPSRFHLRKPIQSETLHILGVASMSTWQGYDRAIKGLANYKGSRPIELHLVGEEGDGSLAKWKTLVQNLGLEKRVHFYPALYDASLDPLMNQASIGLAPLAWYRNKLKNGSALKVREYMSRGLPYVYTIADSAIENDLPFNLQIPDTEETLDMEIIRQFAERMEANPGIVQTMRNYAEKHLLWELELKKLFLTDTKIK